MRHRKKSEKFSRSRAQKKALVKSLVRAVVINEKIKTTTARAKYIRSETEKLITLAKENLLSGRRQAFRILEDHKLVKKLFDDIGPRFKTIKGGYTRIYKVSPRKGDGASMSILELTKIFKKEKASPVKKTEGKTASLKSKTHQKTVKKDKGILSGVKKILKKGDKSSKQ